MELYAFTSYPVFLVSGYSWPINEMPVILQWIGNSIPATPYYNAFLELTQENCPAHLLNHYLVHMMILLVVSMIAAQWRLSYLSKKQLSFS